VVAPSKNRIEGHTQMKNPPILISVLGFFAALAGVGWLFFGLRLLGFDWFGAFGDVPAFEGVGLWGWLALLGGILWLAAALGLWSLRPWAWMVAMVVAGFAVFEAFLWMIQYPGTGLGLSMMLLPGIIILYLLSADVKAAFQLDDQPNI
jgi:hypothetical protein